MNVCATMREKLERTTMPIAVRCLAAVPVPRSTAALEPAALAEAAAAAGMDAAAHASLSEALTAAASHRSPILIAGSLYLAGEVLRIEQAG